MFQVEIGPAQEESMSMPDAGSAERYLLAVRNLNREVRKFKSHADGSVSALNFCEVVAFSGRPFSFEVSLAFQDSHGVPAEVCIYSKLASRMFPPARLLASSLRSVLPKLCDRRDLVATKGAIRELEAKLDEAKLDASALQRRLAQSQAENQQLVEDINLLRGQVVDAGKHAEGLRTLLSKLKEEKSMLERELAETHKALKTAEDDKAALAAELDRCQTRITDLARRLDEQEAPLHDEISSLKLRVEELTAATAAKDRQVDSLQQALTIEAGRRAELEQQVHPLIAKKAELVDQVAMLGAELSAAREEVQRYQALVSDLKGKLAAKDDEFLARQKQLKTTLAARDATIAQMQKEAAAAHKERLQRDSVLSKLERRVRELEACVSEHERESRGMLEQATSGLELERKLRHVHWLEAVRSRVIEYGGIQYLRKKVRGRMVLDNAGCGSVVKGSRSRDPGFGVVEG